MADNIYEEHLFQRDELPFIFHDVQLSDTGEKHFYNWHTNVEVLCCTAGNGYIFCDGESFSVKQGDTVIINSNLMHAFEGTEKFKYYCLIVDRKFFYDNGVDVDGLWFQDFIQDKTLSSKFENVAKAFKDKHPFSTIEIRSVTLDFLVYIIKNYSKIVAGDAGQSVLNSDRVKDAIKYINKNYQRNINLDEIAKGLNISKYYLVREFKKHTNHTIFEYVNIVRCRQAKSHIKEGMSVLEAASACGFENMSYFSRTFKRYMGKLPSKVSKKESGK